MSVSANSRKGSRLSGRPARWEVRCRPRCRSYPGPVSNDAVTIALRQSIGANEPLRTGRYSKALTFTLSTSTP